MFELVGPRIACLLGSHKRLGRKVWWDGFDFRSVCRHCGEQVYKHGNVRWRKAGRKRAALLLTYRRDTPERSDNVAGA